MPNAGNTKGACARAAERRLAAWSLYKRGASFREIGRQLAVSEWTAHHDVHRRLHELDDQERQQARLYRRAILDRNRAMIEAAWPRAVQGDLEAIRAVILLHKEVRELLGLDAVKGEPAVDVTANTGGPRVEETLARLRTEASERAALRTAVLRYVQLREDEDPDPVP